jgi:hydroxymethylglutaryl-CoA reductase
MATGLNKKTDIEANDLFKGFSKLTRDERFERLLALGALRPEDARYLLSGGLKDFSLAEKFIENVVGYFQMPMGVAANFRIDGRDLAIPMAVEETSIIAAASKTAKWVRDHGAIFTESIGARIIGQIQVARVSDFARFAGLIEASKSDLIRGTPTRLPRHGVSHLGASRPSRPINPHPQS